MSTPLLATEPYTPNIGPGFISRPWLLEALNAGLGGRLTLLSAPAGFGKTTLLSDWIHGEGSVLPPGAVAWLSLDEVAGRTPPCLMRCEEGQPVQGAYAYVWRRVGSQTLDGRLKQILPALSISAASNLALFAGVCYNAFVPNRSQFTGNTRRGEQRNGRRGTQTNSPPIV